MASLWEQMIALRTPPAYKIGPPEQWDEHIRSNVLPFLEALTSKQILSPSNPDPFAVLNPAQDALPFLWILHEQITAAWPKAKPMPSSLAPGGAMWSHVVRFVLESNEVEIRYGGARVRQLIEFLASIAHLGKTSNISVLPYTAALMLKVDPTAGTLTSSHVMFCRACLELHEYADALHILDMEIHSLPLKDSPDTPLLANYQQLSNAYMTRESKLTLNITRAEVLEYYLLGAMIYIGLQRWDRALYFLDHVLATPTSHAANGPMLEAYKKWVLVAIMVHGNGLRTPRLMNSTALRTIKGAARPYEAVAEAFRLEDGRKLSAEIHEAWPIFLEDGNSGLVSHVFSHHRRLSVSRLAQLYAAVPLHKVATQLGSSADETQEYLKALIAEGFLQASIEQSRDGGQIVLRFSHGTHSVGKEVQSEEQLLADLTAQTNKLTSLAAHVTEADRRLAMTKEYLEHARRARKSKEGQGDGAVDDGDEPFGGRGPSEDEEDENVMADVS